MGKEPLFESRKLYREKQVHDVVDCISERSLKTLLARLPRIAPTKRCVMYRGEDLNELFSAVSA